MTTIDHRILIPAPPDAVWNFISDITHNPDWQVDCRDVIFLTSRREGPGVRWRYANPDGRECVIAVSAWYNGLGYEYYFVDGMPFRENKGRIRLQEIPEGTIVQWTFTYELGGLFGGMRNMLGVSREVDHTIADSLKTLWQKIKQSGGAPTRVYEAKSLMRDAPDVQARSSYRPRHPTAAGSGDGEKPEPEAMPEPPIREDDGQPISVITEPPIAEDDTRKRVAAAAAQAEPVPADIDGEPEFLDRVVDLSRFEPPRDPSDTQPKHIPAPPEPEAAPIKGEETEPLGFTPPESLPGYPPPLPEPEREEPTVPVVEVGDETQPEYAREPLAADRSLVETEPSPAEEAAPEREEITPSATLDTPVKPLTPPVTETPPAPETVKESTAADKSSSIWEVFGIQRPSETEPMPATASANPEAVVDKPMTLRQISPANDMTHGGLRLALRRKLVRVRRP